MNVLPVPVARVSRIRDLSSAMASMKEDETQQDMSTHCVLAVLVDGNLSCIDWPVEDRTVVPP